MTCTDRIEYIVRFDQNKRTCWDAGSDACLQVADYCGWAIQCKWESDDSAPFTRIERKVRSEYDLFARGAKFYY